jgi:hypothetical protein
LSYIYCYLKKGEFLINQIETMGSEFKSTGLLDANKTPDLFISNKNTSQMSNSHLSDMQKTQISTHKEAWAIN